jgi:hypothetical protein
LLIGLACVVGVGVLWFVASRQLAAPPPPPPPPPPAVERVNPMAQPDLVLEEPKDAGQPAPEPAAVKKPAPGHHAGEWECSGDLAGALKVINENRAQVRSCYERRLKINNVLQGDLMLRLKVGSTGKVVATSIGGSLRDEAIHACVRNLASTWTFQVPTGGSCALVQVPFSFSPKP